MFNGNGASFSTPPSYGRKRGREDDFSSAGRSQRPRHSLDAPGSAGSFRGGRGNDGPGSSRPVDRFKADLYKFGDEDSPAFGNDAQSLATIARHAANMYGKSPEDLVAGFRTCVIEVPHKIKHLGCILSLMDRPNAPAPAPAEGDTAKEETTASVGYQVVGELIKGFENDVATRNWRSMRLHLQLFAHIASLPRPLISSTSLLPILTAFASVTEEFGVGAHRADECVRIVIETLSRLTVPGIETDGVVSLLQAYMGSRKMTHDFLTAPETVSQYEDFVESMYSAQTGEGRLFAVSKPEDPLKDDLASSYNETSITHELPAVIIPLDAEGDIAAESAYTGAKLILRLFEDETVPPRDEPDSIYIRSLILSLIDIFEVNRREAAKVLLELPRWLAPNTFKPKAGAPVEDVLTPSTWILEHVVIETILTSLFALPTPTHKAAYYHSLIVELCKLSPATVAPAMGKCVRRLYSSLGTDGREATTLDVETARRFAEWFSIHLSNFGFSWRWAEWEGDLALPSTHPKRAFIDRLLELEVRLSYFDRIKNSLPEAYKESTTMAGEAPSAIFIYEDSDTPFSGAALGVRDLIRSKVPVEEVQAELATLHTSVQTEEDGSLSASEADNLRTDIATQALLSVGSRSFSHLLNVLERYIALVRELTSTVEARRTFLRTSAKFWRRNPQFLLILLDKLLQYRIVEAADVVEWLFSTNEVDAARPEWTGFQAWDILRSTLLKLVDRVALLTSRLEAATSSAVEGGPSAEELEKIQDGLVNARGEMEDVMVDAATRFTTLAAKYPLESKKDRMEEVEREGGRGEDKVDGEARDWTPWWVQGWFREFCRLLAGLQSRLQESLPTGPETAIPRDLVLNGTKSWTSWTGR